MAFVVVWSFLSMSWKYLADWSLTEQEHESIAGEPALHRGPQSSDFRRIIWSCQAFRQILKFTRAQLPVAGQLVRVPG